MDLIEELKRYKNDKTTNSTITKVYRDQKFRNIEWSEIKVGNLIKVKCNEIIPADLLVICSSNVEGIFYLQTSNIDGESNLKEREALIFTQKIFLNKKIKKDENNLQNLFKEYCEIEVSQPNKNIYEIDGIINYSENDKTPFEIRNTAIRGARLKNTKFIYGIILYTGKDTKIMMNIIKEKKKVAYLDKLVDKIVLIIVIVRIVYVLLFMGIGIIYRKKYLPKYNGKNKEYDYLFYYRHSDGKKDSNDTLENLKYFTSHFILSQTLLPTSVAVLLALTKVIQSIFIEYFEVPLRKNKNEKMKCFSNELLGELGSVKYIFSDKTGTLTKNQTQFKACSIYTCLFDEDNEKNNSIFETNTFKFNSRLSLIQISNSNFSKNFNSESLLQRLNLKNIPLNIKNIEGCPFINQGEALEEFMLNMALNHDVVVESNKLNEEIKYQGTNPDEITLVGAAQELGFCYLGKVSNIISIRKRLFLDNNNKNEILKYELLLKIPFCSERQRSTIIVRDLKTNKIKLYIKGSDTKIFEGINSYSQENILEITKQHVDNFARRGLRTLCYSFKTIPENEYKEWISKYNEIKENLKLEKSFIEEKTNSLIEEIESNCFLLGATALEDQLQDDVEKDITEFIEAGINFWMLTGDKMDTAESIGHSIKLFDSDTEVFKIKGSNQEEIIEKMEEIKIKINKIKEELSNFNIDDNHDEKEDINKKVNTLKLKMKNKVENIYEEEEENDNKNIENDKNKNIYKINEVSLSNISMKEEIKNATNNEKNSNTAKRKNSIGNMSVFKFMIDDEYFKNSNVEYENLSILKDKVVKPHLEFSNKSETSKEGDNNDINYHLYINKKKIENSRMNEINNANLNTNTNILVENNPQIYKVSKKNKNEELKFEINSSNKKNFNNNENIVINENIKFKDIYPKDIEIDSFKGKKLNNKEIDSSRKLLSKKKNSRIEINLPTNAKEFLKYFDTCLEKTKEALYIQHEAFYLFKIPYLYSPPNYLDEEKTLNLKQILKFKNYLLHSKIKYSLIINGESIPYCTSDTKASELFWFLIQNSRSVICCRCSPIQKCSLVQFVKKHTKEITLAIGDGENDVNMIKAANVGIGIFGKEGYQAAYNSDYAFFQFKYLKRLLFFNGRFTLLRNTYFLNMFFFKNFFYTLQPILFTFFNLYSGTFFYDEFYDSMFNTFVSIIPLIIFSIIDEDIDVDFQKYDRKQRKMMLYLLPDMYKQTRDSKPFNIIKYLVSTFLAVIYACLIFIFFNFSYIKMIRSGRGDTITYFELIFYTYFSIIFIHFFMVYIDSSFFNWFIIIFFFVQIFADILFVIAFNRISNDNKLSGIVGEIVNSLISFLTVIINCAICCLPFYILRRAELFFGMNYSNLIKINKLEPIYIGKFYKKKIQQMIRATRAIAKFKKIYKEFLNNKKIQKIYDNLNDIKMIKVIERWEQEKQNKRK